MVTKYSWALPGNILLHKNFKNTKPLSSLCWHSYFQTKIFECSWISHASPIYVYQTDVKSKVNMVYAIVICVSSMCAKSWKTHFLKWVSKLFCDGWAFSPPIRFASHSLFARQVICFSTIYRNVSFHEKRITIIKND